MCCEWFLILSLRQVADSTAEGVFGSLYTRISSLCVSSSHPACLALKRRAQVKTFLFAGHDTTATTVSFTVYEISQHPDVEAKLLEEIDR